jgi:hypothetical protein
MLKKYYFVLATLVTISQADSYDAIASRVGFDFTSFTLTSETNIIAAALPRILPTISLDLNKSVSSNLSFGLSASCSSIRVLKQTYYAYSTSLNSYYHLSSSSNVGLGANILHIPITPSNELSPYFSGYINSLRLGLSMRNLISSRLYTHIELLHDITPAGYRSYEIHPDSSDSVTLAILGSTIAARNYSVNMSLGYSMYDLD